MSLFAIRDRDLEVAEVIAAVSRPSAGAIDVFIGAVRDHNEGRAVTRLEYEAYDSMAVREMRSIAAEIEREVPGALLAAVHRKGALEVGGVAIVCAASAPHRNEAFTACRALIDRIKARVPIWKREWGPDGPYWVGWEDARCTPDGAHASHRHRAEHPHHEHQHHEHQHHEHPSHDHHRPQPRLIRAHTITISDTRTSNDDAGGSLLRELLSTGGVSLLGHAIVPDQPAGIRAEIERALDRAETDAIVCTGGTGITPRDLTYEAVSELLERRLDGFGEAFRRLSWDEIGPRAILSRALAGTYRGRLVFVLPGSPAAVRLGVTRVILPILGHAVDLVRGPESGAPGMHSGAPEPVPPTPRVYPFEGPEIASLALMPLDLRRKLDLAGLHVSLATWQQLAIAVRERWCAAPVDTAAQLEALATQIRADCAGLQPSPREVPPAHDRPWARPEALAAIRARTTGAFGIPVSDQSWERLDDSQRYVLYRLSAHGKSEDKLRAALLSFGVQ